MQSHEIDYEILGSDMQMVEMTLDRARQLSPKLGR